jgi:uncharacterized protein YkwD
MKFAFTVVALSLAQAVCIAAAPTCHFREPGSKKPSPSSLPAPSAAPVSVGSYPLPSPHPVEDAPAPAKPTSAQPAPPANTPSTPAGSSSPGLVSGGKPVIDSINDYRKKANLPLLTWDDKLAANSAKTGNDAGGKALVHELNPGTFGQVLVFGFDDADKCTKDTKSWTPFEIYFLSWLCERPDDPALGGVCTDIANIGRINSGGQTGHHDILASTQYTKIGCAFARDPSAEKCAMFPGVWGCDVA